ncbi:MAG: protein-L-isoaspartate(D-aspartate) O-methyltransferase [Planctomycetota bacterium]|jgi:protein-L-isoaspartate(D-aspartate) O-methyltransferase
MDKQKNEDKFALIRRRMIQFDIKGRGIKDMRVLDAMESIHREDFIPDQFLSQAYADGPLPIGCGQTISQPYIVALMTEELRPDSESEVLEIGTGSGYQTAILAKLSKKVYTVERFTELSASAQSILSRIGITNVEFYIGDGTCGWSQDKQFDRIMVTAAVSSMPEPLIEQLKEGGIAVAPLGPPGVQELVVLQKTKGKIIHNTICGVRFVKLIGEHGFKE